MRGSTATPTSIEEGWRGDHSHLDVSRWVCAIFFLFWDVNYLVDPFPALGWLLGDVPRLRIMIGERLGDLARTMPFSPSGDGDDAPPVAELRRDADSRTMVSRCRNLGKEIKLGHDRYHVSSHLPQWHIIFGPIIGVSKQECQRPTDPGSRPGSSTKNIKIVNYHHATQPKSILLWWLNGYYRSVGRRGCDFRGNARSLRLVDGRIVDLRIAHHADEERSLLGQGVGLAAIHDLRHLVGLLLLEDLRRKVGNDVPSVIWRLLGELKFNKTVSIIHIIVCIRWTMALKQSTTHNSNTSHLFWNFINQSVC